MTRPSSWSTSVWENSFPLEEISFSAFSLLLWLILIQHKTNLIFLFFIHLLNPLFLWTTKSNQDFQMSVSKQALLKGIYGAVSRKSIWDALRDIFLPAPIASENQDFLKYFMSHLQNYWSLFKAVIIFMGIIFSPLICIQSVESVPWPGWVLADTENEWIIKKAMETLKKRIRADAHQRGCGGPGEKHSVTHNPDPVQLFLWILA